MTVNINMSFQVPSNTGEAGAAAKTREKAEGMSFADLMSRSTGTDIPQRQTAAQPISADTDFRAAKSNQNTNISKEAPKASAISTASEKAPSEAPKQDKEPLSEEKIEDCVSAVSKISEDIKGVLTEELGIDEDSLNEIMETLGLSYMDLLNPQALSEVIAQVSEEMPQIDMVNSDLTMELFPVVEDVAESALSDAGITPEEFMQFFEEAQEGEIELPEEILSMLPAAEVEPDNPLFAEMPVNDAGMPVSPVSTEGMDEPKQPVLVTKTETVTVVRIIDDDAGASAASQNIAASNEAAEEAVSGENAEAQTDMISAGEEGSDVLIDASADDNTESSPVQTETESVDDNLTETADQGLKVTVKSEGEAADSQQGTNSGQTGANSGFEAARSQQPSGIADMNTAVFGQQNINSFVESLKEASQAVQSFTSQQTAEIIDQIVTQAQTTISDTVSRMEMELNPQNLGRMIMQVQQQDGIVTARLIAENDGVRSALEKQLAQLQESLDQKGIKVNAVEVSVGAHEFERNLEEGQSNPFADQNESGERESGRGRVRNLNRSELEGDEPMELTEEEELAARIMRQNGGTLDYSA